MIKCMDVLVPFGQKHQVMGNKLMQQISNSNNIESAIQTGNISQYRDINRSSLIPLSNLENLRKIDIKRKMIVYGYLHQIEGVLKINIPYGIIDICLLFYADPERLPADENRLEMMSDYFAVKMDKYQDEIQECIIKAEKKRERNKNDGARKANEQKN